MYRIVISIIIFELSWFRTKVPLRSERNTQDTYQRLLYVTGNKVKHNQKTNCKNCWLNSCVKTCNFGALFFLVVTTKAPATKKPRSSQDCDRSHTLRDNSFFFFASSVSVFGVPQPAAAAAAPELTYLDEVRHFISKQSLEKE